MITVKRFQEFQWIDSSKSPKSYSDNKSSRNELIQVFPKKLASNSYETIVMTKYTSKLNTFQIIFINLTPRITDNLALIYIFYSLIIFLFRIILRSRDICEWNKPWMNVKLLVNVIQRNLYWDFLGLFLGNLSWSVPKFRPRKWFFEGKGRIFWRIQGMF